MSESPTVGSFACLFLHASNAEVAEVGHQDISFDNLHTVVKAPRIEAPEHYITLGLLEFFLGRELVSCL